MFEKWDAQQGKFIDIRYTPYDKQKYPNRKYLESDCDGCDKDNGIGCDFDSLSCRRCIGFEE